MRHWRFIVVQLFFLILAAAIVGRLLYWQVIEHESFVAKASEQHEVTTLLEAKRGRVFASDGSLIVGNEPAFLLYANLSEFKSDFDSDEGVEEIAEQIAKSLLEEIVANQKEPKKLSKEDKKKLLLDKTDELVKRLRSENLVWVPLARKISIATKKKVSKLKISGLGFEEITKRYYPEGALASQLLGFVGEDKDGNDVGYFGLEGFYNEQLRGKPGRLIQELDASGNPILTNDQDGSFPKDGFDLTTTIDRNVQFIIEEEIKDGVKKFGAKLGSVVVLNPKTGEVYGLANYPNFTPNR